MAAPQHGGRAPLRPAVEVFRRERARLAEAFAAADPTEGVGCEGWTAMDLLAHVAAQEQLGGVPVLLASPLVVAVPPRFRDGVRAAVLERTSRRLTRSASYERMVDLLRRRSPSLFELPVIVHTRIVEMWVHHEDLRRQGSREPRPHDDRTRSQLWAAVRLLARRVSPPPDVGLTLDAGDGRRVRAGRRRSRPVSVSGEPGELLLYLLGRRAWAQVDVSGDPIAVAFLDNGWRLL